jgi:MmyB-like transcription regulator ligand binding domain
MIGTTALLNGRLDILGANALGVALFAPIYADPIRPVNNSRFIFLDPRAAEFFRERDKVANDVVAMLHAEADASPQAANVTPVGGVRGRGRCVWIAIG